VTHFLFHDVPSQTVHRRRFDASGREVASHC
jgi:hypothetical protein